MAIDDASTYTFGHCMGARLDNMTVNGVGWRILSKDQVQMDSELLSI